jgi:hypothetical protein
MTDLTDRDRLRLVEIAHAASDERVRAAALRLLDGQPHTAWCSRYAIRCDASTACGPEHGCERARAMGRD